MSIYNGMSGKESNLEESYVFLDLAGQVALRVGSILYFLSDDPILILTQPDRVSYAPHPTMFCCITDCLFIQTLTLLFGDSREEKRTTGGCIFGTLCPLSFGRYVRINLLSPSISDMCVDTFRAWSLDVLQVF